MDKNRLALGTVQFGMPYGVANQAGQVRLDEAAAILERAWSVGIDTIDTAIAYGESEQRLGEIGVRQWRIISKLPPALPEACENVAAWVQEAVLGSLERLRIPRLYGLLLHRSQQLLSPQGDALYRALIMLKNQGLVEKIGVSIYEPSELDALWPHFKLDLVQAPFNVFDRRLASSGWLTKLYEAGVEIHTRSVFLQGLLLMPATGRPAAFNRWQQLWGQWDYWLAHYELTPLQTSLNSAMSRPEIDRIIVGVDTLKQLEEIISACEMAAIEAPVEIASEDLDLIDTRRWNLK